MNLKELKTVINGNFVFLKPVKTPIWQVPAKTLRVGLNLRFLGGGGTKRNGIFLAWVRNEAGQVYEEVHRQTK